MTNMNQEIGYLLKHAQQLLRTALDNSLRALNLSMAQYAALNALEQTPNASNAVLARACFVTPQTMIEILKGLESEGYITRQAHPEHGRIIQTVLSSSGQQKLALAHNLVLEIQDRMTAGLAEREKEQFVLLLEACCKNLEDA
jgi:DNA-binding MarR family transcriptional regulator